MFLRKLTLVAVLTCIAIPAAAGVLREDKSDTDWEILLAPYLWGTSMKGETAFSPVPPLGLDVGFSDILSNANFAASLHTEFHRGKWAFVIDPTYISLEVDDIETPDPSLQPKADIDIWLVELWGAYKITANWELLAGARWQDQDMEIKGLGGLPVPVPPGPVPDPVKAGDDWLDWFAGVRAIYPLGQKWILSARGDIVFAGDSDSSYNLELFFNRRFGKSMALNLGYRYLKDDYDNLPTYSWDVEQQGPVVGYTWAF